MKACARESSLQEAVLNGLLGGAILAVGYLLSRPENSQEHRDGPLGVCGFDV
jgi:hypothetical protein